MTTGHVLDLQGLAEPHPAGFTDRVTMGSVASVVDSAWTTVSRPEEQKPGMLG